MRVKRTLVSLASTLVLLGGLSGTAAAEEATVYGDAATSSAAIVLNAPCQLPTAVSGSVAIRFTTATKHYAAGESLLVEGIVTLAGNPVSTITVSGGSGPVPTPWESRASMTVPITTTIGSGTSDGDYQVIVKVTGGTSGVFKTALFPISVSCGSDADGDGIHDEQDNCPFTASTDQSDSDKDGIGNLCDDTPYGAAPSSPGTPEVQGANPTNSGVLSLGWAPASDPEGDPITYSVQQRDADDLVWTTVGLHLEVPVYATTPDGEQEEGTWRYRVFAYDGTLDSEPSLSPPVIVDKSAPAPLTTDVPAAHPSGWHKGGVTVRFHEHGDPLLVDGSPGSGVDADSYEGERTITQSGIHTVTETVEDLAGNRAEPTTVTVEVDATPPTVTMDAADCPDDLMVLVDAAASVDWTASDAHSGLATPTSGSVQLDTDSVGRKSVTIPTATDNVGYTSPKLTCDYRVVFDWGGFAQPIRDGWNKARAGSAVPVKFTLGGDHGLGVLEQGSPRVVPVSCPAANGTGGGTPTGGAATSAAISELKYTPGSRQYQFLWNTADAMAGTCLRLDLELIDATTRSAFFTLSGAGGGGRK